MRLDDRDHMIAVAEAHLRDGDFGVPELLGADYVSLHELLQSIEQLKRSYGKFEAVLQEKRKYLMEHPPRPEWRVIYVLRDPRYVNGITVATVMIDAETEAVRVEVVQRRPPTVA